MREDKGSSLRWLWVSSVVVLLDQLTKIMMESSLRLYQKIELLPVFNLTLVYNKGAAFSFLADAAGWQRWFFSGLAAVVSGALVFWLNNYSRPGSIWEVFGVSLIIGGAWGNLLDRVRLGHVVDFIQFHWYDWYFPAFNIADSAITLGAGLMILDVFLQIRSYAVEK
ncbi:lipoprotein signal peptidase [Gammaproteobacteria bacterium]